MNKKAVFMDIYLVFLTLFMCGFVIVVFFLQSGKVENSLVSSVEVLRMEDNVKNFEYVERCMLKDSFVGDKCGFGEEKDIENNFCDVFSQDLDVVEIIFVDLYYQERDATEWGSAFKDSVARKDFCLDVYDFECKSNGDLRVRRIDFGKRFNLVAEEESKINFPVVVEYSFDKEFSFSKKEVVC
jgi:hypothetical protein